MSLRPRIPEALRPRIWWWIVAATVLHIGAWAAWFVLAAHHPVADVPLAR
jgi:hypothetical protein